MPDALFLLLIFLATHHTLVSLVSFHLRAPIFLFFFSFLIIHPLFLKDLLCLEGMAHIDRQGFHSIVVPGLVGTNGFAAPPTMFSTELRLGSTLIGTKLKFVTLILDVNFFWLLL